MVTTAFRALFAKSIAAVWVLSTLVAEGAAETPFENRVAASQARVRVMFPVSDAPNSLFADEFKKLTDRMRRENAPIMSSPYWPEILAAQIAWLTRTKSAVRVSVRDPQTDDGLVQGYIILPQAYSGFIYTTSLEPIMFPANAIVPFAAHAKRLEPRGGYLSEYTTSDDQYVVPVGTSFVYVPSTACRRFSGYVHKSLTPEYSRAVAILIGHQRPVVTNPSEALASQPPIIAPVGARPAVTSRSLPVASPIATTPPVTALPGAPSDVPHRSENDMSSEYTGRPSSGGAVAAVFGLLIVFGIIAFVAARSSMAGERNSKQKAPPPPAPKSEHARSNATDSEYRGGAGHQSAAPDPPLTKDERYYARVLGLKGKLTRADLKKCYRDLVAKYHPDKVQHLGAEFQDMAEQKAKLINEAYEFFRERYGI